MASWLASSGASADFPAAGEPVTMTWCWERYTRTMSIERKMIYEGRVIKVSVDTVVLPNGMRVPLEIVRHPGGAAVVAIDGHRPVCLLRQ